jgi:hypothetical protein
MGSLPAVSCPDTEPIKAIGATGTVACETGLASNADLSQVNSNLQSQLSATETNLTQVIQSGDNNLQAGHNAQQNAINSVQAQANSQGSTLTSHASTLTSHASTLSSHSSQISSLNGTVSSHTSSINSLTSSKQTVCANGALRGWAAIDGGALTASYSNQSTSYNCGGGLVQARKLGTGEYYVRFVGNASDWALVSGGSAGLGHVFREQDSTISNEEVFRLRWVNDGGGLTDDVFTIALLG